MGLVERQVADLDQRLSRHQALLGWMYQVLQEIRQELAELHQAIARQDGQKQAETQEAKAGR